MFRPLEASDIPFVFALRRSPHSQLHPVSEFIEDQYRYFEQYQERFLGGLEVYYLLADRHSNKQIGLVRLTRIDHFEEFSWDSLIFLQDAEPFFAIDAYIAIFETGFTILKRKQCGPFPVLKSNERIQRLHRTMGICMPLPLRSGNYIMYVATCEAYRRVRHTYLRRGFGCVVAME